MSFGQIKRKQSQRSSDLETENASLKQQLASLTTQLQQLKTKAGSIKAKSPPPVAGGSSAGSVEHGPSKGAAAAGLGALFAKRKPPPTADAGVEAEDADAIILKWEKKLKMGIPLNGVLTAMTRAKVDPAIIKTLNLKHSGGGGGGGEEEKHDVKPEDLGLKPKKAITVSKDIKMKRLHWEPVPLHDMRGTVWLKLGKDVKYISTHFELNFQERPRKPRSAETKTSSKTAGKKELVKFVKPPKRVQQCLIGYRGLKWKNEEIKNILLQMDEKKMTQDTLEKFMDFAPSHEEQMEAERVGAADPTAAGRMDVVEKFFYTLYDFNDLKGRLDTWLYKMQFDETRSGLLEQYGMVSGACDRLKANKNLRLLLNTVLQFGNHMNAGTKKGQTYGYQLKILDQLTSVKTFDNSKTLVMYLYEFCDKNVPDALKAVDELEPTLKKVAHMETGVMRSASDRIRSGLKDIQLLIEDDNEELYDMDDQYLKQMTIFYKIAQKKMDKFDTSVKIKETQFHKSMKYFYFGQNESEAAIEDMFKLLLKFFKALTNAEKELIKLEKQRRARVEKKKREKKAAKKKGGGKSTPKEAPADKEALPVPAVSGLKRGVSRFTKNLQKQDAFKAKLDTAQKNMSKHMRKKTDFVKSGGATVDKSLMNSMSFAKIQTKYKLDLEDSQRKSKLRRQESIQQLSNRYGRLPGFGPVSSISETESGEEKEEESSHMHSNTMVIHDNVDLRRQQTPAHIKKRRLPQLPTK